MIKLSSQPQRGFKNNLTLNKRAGGRDRMTITPQKEMEDKLAIGHNNKTPVEYGEVNVTPRNTTRKDRVEVANPPHPQSNMKSPAESIIVNQIKNQDTISNGLHLQRSVGTSFPSPIGRRQGEHPRLPKAMLPTVEVYERRPDESVPTMQLPVKQHCQGGRRKIK